MGNMGAKNQFHFHMLFTFNDDTRLESLRDVRLSETLLCLLQHGGNECTGFFPQKPFRLTKAVTLQFF